METDHRLAISEGRSAKRDKFGAACRKAKFTLSSLADKLGCDKSTLSRYRSGDRETPLGVAAEVAKLIDWPADRAHWPKLGS